MFKLKSNSTSNQHNLKYWQSSILPLFAHSKLEWFFFGHFFPHYERNTVRAKKIAWYVVMNNMLEDVQLLIHFSSYSCTFIFGFLLFLKKFYKNISLSSFLLADTEATLSLFSLWQKRSHFLKNISPKCIVSTSFP